jgi:hypothetical protein
MTSRYSPLMSTTYACEYIVRPPIQTQTPQNAKGLLPYRLPYQYVHHVKPFLQKDLRE